MLAKSSLRYMENPLRNAHTPIDTRQDREACESALLGVLIQLPLSATVMLLSGWRRHDTNAWKRRRLTRQAPLGMAMGPT